LKEKVGELRLEMELTAEDRAQLPAQMPLLPAFDSTTTP